MRTNSVFHLDPRTLARQAIRFAILMAAILVSSNSARAAIYYWVGGHDKFWNTTGGVQGTNWSTSPDVNNNSNPLIPGSGDDVTLAFNTGVATANPATDIGQSFSIKGLVFSADPTVAMSVNDVAGTHFLTLGSDGVTLQSGSLGGSINANTILGAAQTWTNNSSSALTLGGVLSGSATNGLTFGGTGLFVFTGADTYSGSTTLSAAGTTLTLSGAAGSILNTSAITLNGGSVLNLTSTGANQASQNRIADSQGITSNGGTFNLLGNAATPTTETIGTFSPGSGMSNINVTGAGATLTLGSSAISSFGSHVAGAAVNFSSTGIIATPNLTLNTGIVGGWATIGSLSGTGAGNVLDFATVSGGTIAAYTGYSNNNVLSDFVAGNNVKLSGATALTATASTTTINSLYMTGSAQVYFGTGPTGTASSTNTLVINSGAIISNGAAGTGSINNQPVMTQIAMIGSTLGTSNSANGPTYQGRITSGNGVDLIIDTASNLRINSIITDNGATSIGLTKNGAGLLDLSDGNNQTQPSNGTPGVTEIANTYSGITTINGGTILINEDQNLGKVPASFTANSITLNGGELLTTRGFSFAGNRGITVGPQGGILAYNGGATWTIAQKITGPGGVTFASVPQGSTGTNSNTLSLTSTANFNNYQGPTVLQTQEGSLVGNANIIWNSDEQIPDTSAVTVLGISGTGGSGGINFNNHKETIGSLASAAGVGLIKNLGNFTTGGNNLSTNYGGLISGTGGTFTKVGNGAQTLSGSVSYSGATNVNAGTLLITGTSAGAGAVTVGAAVGASAYLGGSGIIVGPVTINGHLAPATSPTGTSNLTVNNSVTFAAGATFDFNFGTTAGTAAYGTADLLTIGGAASNLTLNTGTNDILNITQLPGFGIGYYKLVDYSAISGAISLPGNINTSFTINGGTNFNYSILKPGDPNYPSFGNKQLVLDVLAGNPALTWTGAAGSGGNGTWDIGITPNWTSVSAGNLYADGDNLTFDDTGSNTNITISNGGSGVSPNSMVFNNSLVNYTIGGDGINGTGGLTKNQAGSVTLNNVNGFTGTTKVTAGALNIGSAGSIASSVVTVTGGTLNVAGALTGNPAMTANSGVNFTSANQTFNSLNGNSSGLINLAGPTNLTVSTGGNFLGSVIGPNSTLTVNGGALVIGGSATYTGSTTIASGGTLQIGTGGSGNPFSSNGISDNGTLTFDTADTLNIGAAITGGGGVVQNGLGTVVLASPSNFYFGGTAINSGVLGFVQGGLGFGTVNFAGGTLQWTSGNTQDISSQFGAVVQPMVLDMNGNTVSFGTSVATAGSTLTLTGTTPGALILTATNNFTGGVTISTGTLQLGNGFSEATLGATTLTDNGTFAFNQVSPYTAGPVISGSGSVVQLGPGAVTISGANGYTNGTFVNAGTLLSGNASAFGAVGSNITVASGATLDVNAQAMNGQNYNVMISGSGVTGDGSIINSSTAAQISALNRITLLGDATIGGTGRWDVRSNGTFPDAIVGNGFSLTKADANYFAINGGTSSVTGVANININQGTISIENNTVIDNSVLGSIFVNSGGTLGVGNQGGTIGISILKPIVMAGGTIWTNGASASGNATIAAPISLNAPGVVLAQPASNLALNGMISDGINGSMSLGVLGGGTVSLGNSVNTYTGGTTVAAGTILIASGTGALGGPTAGNLANVTLAANTILGDSLPVDQPMLARIAAGSTANVFTVALAASSSNNLDYSAGGANLTAATLGALGSQNYSGILTPNGTTYRLGGGGGVLTMKSALTGSGNSLVVGGVNNGTVALTSTNDSYGGGTTINAGNTLEFARNTLPAGSANPIVFSGGTLQWAGGNTQDMSSGIPSIASGQTAILDTNGNSVSFASPIGGSGGLNKIGAGVLTLAAPNAYIGSTTVTAGTLNVSVANAVAGPTIINNGNAILNNAGGLQLSTVTQNATNGLLFGPGITAPTLGGLSGSASFALVTTDAVPLAVNLAVGNNNQNATYTGVLAGSGALTKVGAGTQTVSGLNTYTGGTTINGGSLLSASPISLGAGPVTLGNGGTLRITGGSIAGFGGNGAGWTLNGGATAATDVLTITTTANTEARSAFNNTKFSANNFNASFVYTETAGTAGADGATFTIQNSAPTALGGNSGGFGYQGIAPSVALEFSIWSGRPDGVFYTSAGTMNYPGTNGSNNTAPVSILSKDPIRVNLSYNGTTLVENLIDLITSGTFSTSYNVNIPASIGGNTAYIGFTGGTGGANALQTFSGFSYTVGTSYANSVVLPSGANASIAVAYSALSMGSLNLGNSATLNVSPDTTLATNSAYTLTLGAATVGNNATINVANNGTGGGSLVLGSLAMGNSTLQVAGGTPATPISVTVAGPTTLSGTSASTFNVRNSYDTLTLNGAVTGAAAVATTGQGTLVLVNASNSYTGGTSIGAGSVLVAAGTASLGGATAGNFANVAVAAGGVLADSLPLDQPMLGRIAASSTGTAFTVALDANSSNNLNFSSSGANLSLASLGAVGTQNYTGTLTPNGTTYRLGGGSGTIVLPNSPALTDGASPRSLVVNGSVSLSGVNSYSGGSVINSTGVLIAAGTSALGPASASVTAVSGAVLADSVAMDQAMLGEIAPSSTGNAFTLALAADSNNTLDFSAAGANLPLASLGAVGSHNYGGALTPNAGIYRLGGGPGTITLPFNTLTDGAGSQSLIVSGNVVLGGANSYSGGTTVTGSGVLSISSDGNLGAVPGVAQPANITLNGGVLQFTASSAFNTSTINTNRGITLGVSGGTISLPVVTTGAFGSTETAFQYRGIIAGSGNLTFSGGTGTNSGATPYILELGGSSNSYTGTTTVNNAILTPNNVFQTVYPTGILPTTTVLNLINNGWFSLNDGNSNQTVAGLVGDATGKVSTTNSAQAVVVTIDPAMGQTYNFAGVIGAQTVLAKAGANTALSLVINGPGTQILSGANTYTGATTISSGVLQLGSGGASGSLATGSVITDNGTLAFNRSNSVSQGVDFNGGAITGNGGLLQMGPGTLVLNAANTYMAGTTVSGGSLQLGNANALGSGGLTANAGMVNLNGFSLTASGGNALASLAGVAGTITDNSAVAGNTTLMVTQPGTTTFGGSIRDGSGGKILSLDMNGTGLLNLSGANAFSGGTVVTSGTVDFTVASALPTAGGLSIGSGGDVILGTGGSAAPAPSSASAGAPSLAPVPEPSTFGLLAIGAMFGLFAWRRRK